MPQQVFYIGYIYSFFEQMGGKTMPKAMYATVFYNACLFFGIAEYLLYFTSLGRRNSS